MTTLDLSADTVAQLQGAADRRGVTIEALIGEMAAGLADTEPSRRRRNLAFAGIGASEHGITHRIDDLLADGFGRD